MRLCRKALSHSAGRCYPGSHHQPDHHCDNANERYPHDGKGYRNVGVAGEILHEPAKVALACGFDGKDQRPVVEGCAHDQEGGGEPIGLHIIVNTP